MPLLASRFTTSCSLLKPHKHCCILTEGNTTIVVPLFFIMNIVADSNVYIASMRRSGLKRKILWRILETNNTLILTDFILDELRTNFAELYSPKQSQIALDLLLQFLGSGALIVKTKDEYEQCLTDAAKYVPRKDTPVLAATMLKEIDYLMTWDAKHFLNNKKLMDSSWGAKIKHPDEILELLK